MERTIQILQPVLADKSKISILNVMPVMSYILYQKNIC